MECMPPRNQILKLDSEILFKVWNPHPILDSRTGPEQPDQAGVPFFSPQFQLISCWGRPVANVAFQIDSGLWRDFSPQMASNMLWAYGKAGGPKKRRRRPSARWGAAGFDPWLSLEFQGLGGIE